MNLHRTLLAISLAVGLGLSGGAGAQVSVDPADDMIVNQFISYQDSLDRDAFVDLLVAEFGGNQTYYRVLLDANTLSQGELYYACTVGAVSSVPCATIVDQRRNIGVQGQGWGELALRYGIEPGSTQFHAVKNHIQMAHGRLSGPMGPRMMGHDHDPGLHEKMEMMEMERQDYREAGRLHHELRGTSDKKLMKEHKEKGEKDEDD